jgi:oligopeptide/dipeptide ABC transporter ATP-binding protein
MTAERLLEVEGLSVHFPLKTGLVHAVEEVDLYVRKGETVGLAGESGCGKSTLARAILRLVPRPGRTVAGAVRFDGADLLGLAEQELRPIRGTRLSLIFQDPSTFLNPTVSVGRQICDVIMAHGAVGSREAREQTLRLLEDLGIPEPSHRFNSFPHELSGGMKQRALIAMAICADPQLVIADEPTTALDVTIQRQILELIKDKVIRGGSALLFITHDLSILAEICDRVYTMYAGRVVEHGPTGDFFANPLHPYTRKLLTAIPRHDLRRPLSEIPGVPPRLDSVPEGCSFHPRCDLADDRCLRERPRLRELGREHRVSCHHA